MDLTLPDPGGLARRLVPALPGAGVVAGLGAHLPDPLAPVRATVGGTLRDLFTADRMPGERYDAPLGDPGWFGPDSVTWTVHADPAMLVGGLTAVMLQTLHPLAMAGVAEHSDFRERPLERLGRTSSFVIATTYGATPVAERMARAVRAIHGSVVGTAPDGRPYAAGDPDLLRWVHVAEFHSFVRAHQLYAVHPVGDEALDRYWDEVAVIAEALGATEVPRSRAEVDAYLRAVRPELVAGPQAREALRFLVRPIPGPLPLQAAYLGVVRAALGALPGWARRMLRVPRLPGLDLAVVRPATRTALAGLRLLAGDPPTLAEARARVAA
ncbi:oxygenase MpaB family protein [Iamia majanohamensis]|uniref:Oxygenase MpaB family protein n=1 Tax=Iamia majanohamensis TaxID=467976 RepID=A0AAE9Y3H0_9ACTN|nr:oxygenase MpaB family protein [Iamia majanohamensis]WCO65314.1 oxygenase MpaB family protein [Iamia majanohamensis]